MGKGRKREGERKESKRMRAKEREEARETKEKGVVQVLAHTELNRSEFLVHGERAQSQTGDVYTHSQSAQGVHHPQQTVQLPG